MSSLRLAAAGLILLPLLACSSDDTDAATDTGAATDTSMEDAQLDVDTTDTGAADDSGGTEPDTQDDSDTMESDTTVEDTTPEDTTPEDTMVEDTTAEDTTPEDTMVEDTTPDDTGGDDTRPEDTAPSDTGAEDTGPSDTGGEDTDTGPDVVTGTNPVLGRDNPDPHVLRTVAADGSVSYVLMSTPGTAGDIPMYTSTDLVSWTPVPGGAFGRTSVPGDSIELNGAHYCHLWAPDLVEVETGVYMLSFSATRFETAQSPCPAYHEDGGVYVASSSSPTGPFAVEDRPWEPLVLGTNPETCDATTTDAVPGSLAAASGDCQGGLCHHVVRLDSYVWQDPDTSRWWMGYSWYTNDPPLVDWERDNHGEHVNLLELDGADPFTVVCDADAPQLGIGNPHNAATIDALSAYCPRCDEQLAFDRGRMDEEMSRSGSSWAIAEGVGMFRHGGYVYALMSGSAWDSAYYHVYWVAAPTVEGLAYSNPDRLEGRYLIPSEGQAFGHGTPVLGPDGEHWYYVHHRLDHAPCRDAGVCARDVWVSPITFEDRGDGRGEVWIQPRFPAEDTEVEVVLGE